MNWLLFRICVWFGHKPVRYATPIPQDDGGIFWAYRTECARCHADLGDLLP